MLSPSGSVEEALKMYVVVVVPVVGPVIIGADGGWLLEVTGVAVRL